MAGSSQNTKSKQIHSQNSFLESIKEVGSSAATSLKTEVLEEGSKDFMRQLLGIRKTTRKVSGEIEIGQEVVMEEVFSGEHEEKVKYQKQISFERRIHQEELRMVERKSEELKVQLQAITSEIEKMAKATPKLTQELEIAKAQDPVDPGIYHIVFFEKLFEYIKSFRQKIEDASLWLASLNKRSGKKRGNWVQNYKNQGAKYLLSGEHYLTRSAG